MGEATAHAQSYLYRVGLAPTITLREEWLIDPSNFVDRGFSFAMAAVSHCGRTADCQSPRSDKPPPGSISGPYTRAQPSSSRRSRFHRSRSSLFGSIEKSPLCRRFD